MDWIASEPISTAHTERILQNHLLESARAALPADEPEPCVVREAAHSVAVYCRAAVMRGVTTQELHVLFSRALWSVGRMDAARQVLELGVESRRMRVTLLALLSGRALSPDLWSLVGAGAIRLRERSVAFDAEAVWCVDTSRISGWESDTELARHLALQRILSLLAPVWDAASGQGMLAIRCTTPDKEEIKRLARNRLRKVASARQWQHCPHVVQLRL